MSTTAADPITSVATLADPQRRRLYEAVRAARRPLTREEAASAVDVSRKLAAFHLDKLVAAGLLEVAPAPDDTPRRVGRTPKRYQPVTDTTTVNVPPRSYQELATVLVLAAATQQERETPAEAQRRIGRERGHQLGAAMDRRAVRGRLGPERAVALVESVLTQEGFEPYRSAPLALRLANCPFHPVTACAPGVVCGINVEYLEGLLTGLSVESLVAVLEPRVGECCVEIRPRS